MNDEMPLRERICRTARGAIECGEDPTLVDLATKLQVTVTSVEREFPTIEDVHAALALKRVPSFISTGDNRIWPKLY